MREAIRAGTPKSEQTRTLILETALGLFREHGYDGTTMRAIAQRAGVSVGNAYYYFASKEHLVQGFYDRLAAEHRAAAVEALHGVTDLGERIRIVLSTWLDVAEPYHAFAAAFFKNAADPSSPLSPFSAESKPARDMVIDLHRLVLDGSSLRHDAEIGRLVPELLWLHHLGIVLYWAHDKTPHAERTRRLAVRTAGTVARVVRLSKYKMVRPLVREADGLLREFLISEPEVGEPETGQDLSEPDRDSPRPLPGRD
ncbi:TetR/AcrR family transcriptional regulator [Actinospica sp.]|uniref:TetR/AcrR family transcriptional regulator n=1 Tax=Actinospica sp. TaxID=1872142 RepID=UPI002BE82CC5|nr:TetR family transcriptional regulator [Actinospica sp.]HWG27919.1 TetR family transcriptional regulator [Actinospica sp.]